MLIIKKSPDPGDFFIPYMVRSKYIAVCWCIVFLIGGYSFFACQKNSNNPVFGSLQLVSISVGNHNINLSPNSDNPDVPADQPLIITFSSVLDTSTVLKAVRLSNKSGSIPFSANFSSDKRIFSITPGQDLRYNQLYTLDITNQLKGLNKEIFTGVSASFTTIAGILKLSALKIGGYTALGTHILSGISKNLSIEISFNKPLDRQTVTAQSIIIKDRIHNLPLVFSFSGQDTVITMTSSEKLKNLTKYSLFISDQLRGTGSEVFQSYSQDFYSTYDSVPVMTIIPDDELLTLIQKQTFKYFWDFGHPVSGLARERNSSGNLVTTGGSGFGIMAIIVGIDRGFISRVDGIGRIQKIVDFLGMADRFHGAWPHWLDGTTGAVIPFSAMDDGGDLVETSYLSMGLLTARQYLNPADSAENQLITKISDLWQGIDWTWYTQGGQKVLYWHWSPDYYWAMNMPIRGYDEALITYLMVASSPTHSIDADVYHQGWAAGSSFINGKTYYGYPLPLGPDYGGPLFYAHYTFLGLNPHGLSDAYADYWTQNVNHTSINREYCIQNPRQYIGYGTNCWGLTASDNQDGYSAQSPTNDLGVITPTAAISSIPYTPGYSMDAIRFFYYTLGDRLWGPYGFYDAFNLTDDWTANSYLAIDEGPIIVMLENYWTGLLWNLFMSCPEVQSGIIKLGFSVN